MSQVQTRPSLSATSPRGRGSSRGGRGGNSFTSRGGSRGAARNSNNSNGDSFDNEDPIEDQGEFGALKKKYPTQLAQLRELFPALSSQDILLELKESNGNLDITADKLTEGTVPFYKLLVLIYPTLRPLLLLLLLLLLPPPLNTISLNMFRFCLLACWTQSYLISIEALLYYAFLHPQLVVEHLSDIVILLRDRFCSPVGGQEEEPRSLPIQGPARAGSYLNAARLVSLLAGCSRRKGFLRRLSSGPQPWRTRGSWWTWWTRTRRT